MLSAWLLPIDGLTTALALLLTHGFHHTAPGLALSPDALGAAFIYATTFTLAGLAGGLYDPCIDTPRTVSFRRFLLASLAATLATLACQSLVSHRHLGGGLLAGAVALSGALMLVPRATLSVLVRLRRTRVVLAGYSSLTSVLSAALESQPMPLYEVVGKWPSVTKRERSAQDLFDMCCATGADEIVVPARSADLDPILAQTLPCLPLGCRIRSDLDFYENLTKAIPVDHLTFGWLVSRGFDPPDAVGEVLKRASDVMLAAGLLVVASPLLLFGVIAVWLGRDGPVFFSQVRVGRFGKPFRILKLRTMRTDAERDGPRWAERGDARRTAAGVILRRTRIDELPQLVNVLLGQMSVVGPRPERPEFVADLGRRIPFYGWRHMVRPGLTGWAQINRPYGSSVRDAHRKLEYDLYYVRNGSVAVDLAIVLRTMGAGFRGSR